MKTMTLRLWFSLVALWSIVLSSCSADRSVVTADPIVPAMPAAIKATPISTATLPPVMPALTPVPDRHRNPFGLLLGSESLSDQQRIALIKALGVNYFRPWYVTAADWNGACYDPACDMAKDAGLKLILTVRNNVDAGGATTPATDIEHYRQTITAIVDTYHPEVLVVENEESSEQFWNGTPDQYAAELKAACDAAHRAGSACANGGLSSAAIGLLVWADYIDRGQMTEACSFVQRANDELPIDLCRFTATQQLSSLYQDLLAKSRRLIDIYKTSGQDYLNLHWYIPDKAALSEAVGYLRRATKLPMMSNEMGQRDQSPEVVDKLLSAALDLNLSYVVWFSFDRNSYALQNDDGSLRPNGEAFRNFMQARFQSVAELPPIATPTIAPTAIPVYQAKPAPVAPSAALTFTQVLNDVTYCTADDGTDLKMDMYFPLKPAGPAPVVMFVHGGGWVAGTKAGTPGTSYFLELNRRGYLVTSIDYRLAPTSTFPSNIEDVKCAVRSLRAHAQAYNLDPQRIGAWGASAGGHLVALLGTSDSSAGWDVGQYLDQSSRVQVVVDLYGISDLTTEYVVGNVRGLDRMVFGARDPLDPILRQASPTTYITPDDPPFLIMHGDMDNVVPFTQSQVLHERLMAGGVSSTYIQVHNGGHGFNAVGGPIDPPYAEIARTILNFFDHYLR
jgi:acetyl esterase/lipase